VKRDPNSAAAWAALADLALAAGTRREARGEDGRPALARAAEAYGRMTPAEADAAALGYNRALARYGLAAAEQLRSGPAEPAFTAAIADLEAVLRARPGFGDAHNLRGNARHHLGELAAARGEDAKALWSAAEADFREAIRLGFGLARFNLGLLLRSMARFDEAIAAFEEGGRETPAQAEWVRARVEETRHIAREAAGGK